MIERNPSVHTVVIVAVLLSLLAAPAARAEGPARYEAALSDGTRVEGSRLTGWHAHGAVPELDGAPLHDAKRHLLWFRNRGVERYAPGANRLGFVAFAGGDRFVGRVLGAAPRAADDGAHVPPHLLAAPAGPRHLPGTASLRHVRILPGRIQRVVWGPAQQRRLQPGTLFRVDGRQLGFLHLRWQPDSVLLLLKGGTRKVPLSSIAEVHLPRIDPWQAYFEELAVLSPGCRSRLVRLETTGGLIATGSGLRFRASPFATAEEEWKAAARLKDLDGQIERLLEIQRAAGEIGRCEQHAKQLESLRAKRAAAARGQQGSPGIWRHMVQPVWSLDPLWVPFRSIHTRWSFAPERVPLCRVHPAATVSPPLLPWATDCNAGRGALCSGGRQHGWGFAVHAHSELRFALPPCAIAFGSGLGLDRAVGAGGCVRARVYVGSAAGKVLYESPLLVGSSKAADTGRLRLPVASEHPRRLVLQADPAHDNRPPGADPLNIRDKLDWLDPWVGLDRDALQEEVRGKLGPLIADAPGWKLGLDPRGAYTWASHFHRRGRPGGGRFLMMLRAEGRPLTLSREMTIQPSDRWLAVRLGLPTGTNPRPDAVSLHVGGRRVEPRKIPLRQRWQRGPTPLAFPLEAYRGRKVTLELRQPPGGALLHWQAVKTSAKPPPPYRLVDTMARLGEDGVQVSHAFGRALLSGRMGEPEARAALAISRHGGIVNFKSPYEAEVSTDRPVNVLVGKEWRGGDAAFTGSFATLKRMPALETLLVTHDSGVSRDAVARARAELPGLTVKRFARRVPSVMGGPHCNVTWRNLTQKELLILYINAKGGLQGSRYLKPGQEMRRPSQVGSSYEAHYLRWHHSKVDNYIPCPPLATHIATPGAVWEITPPEE
jgi:hypothetical protein